MPRENLISLFEEFERYRDDVAIVERRGYRREQWTYQNVARAAIACAQELQKRSVKTGDRVMLWGTNSAAWTTAFWGCLLRGAVAVPMDDGATPDFAARVVRDAGVKLIFAAREKPALYSAIPRLVLEDFSDTLQDAGAGASSLDGSQPSQTRYESLADEPI